MTISEKRKAYLRDYQRQWVARRRAEFFADKACVRCGSQERLELDHIDPKLKVSHNVWSWSEAKRSTEIAKCQVLCHDCHWQKTRDDYGWRQVHGTVSSYNHYGCRCAVCTNAAVSRSRSYRAYKRLTQTRIETP